MAPLPPPPARATIRARSWNIVPGLAARSGSWLLGTDDRDRPALAARGELHPAVARGEDRVVAADGGAVPGPEAGAALTHDDHPGLDLLAGEDLDAEALRRGVATVAGGSETLLVRHACSLLRFGGLRRPAPGGLRRSRLGGGLGRRSRLVGGSHGLLRPGWTSGLGADRLDLDLREPRPEAVPPSIPRSALVLADDDLVAEKVLRDPSGDDLALQVVRAQPRLAVAAEQEHVRLERRALVVREAIDEQPFALPDPVLLSADLDDRVRQRSLQP